MKILISGNLGYIGPVLTKHLKQTIPSSEITGLDIGYFASRISSLGRIGDTYCNDQIYQDIRDVSFEFLKKFDAVIILSAISNDPMGNKFEDVTNQINYLAVKKIIEPYLKLKNKRLVFASSCSIYGASEGEAKKENDTLNPLTAYAKSKVAVEKALQKCELGLGTTATSLRFATACGMSDRLRLDLVLNDFVASAIIHKRIEVLSDGTPWRPLIHVKDMARAIEWGILRNTKIAKPYLAVNVGSNSWNYRVSDLAKAVVETVPDCQLSFNEKALPDKRSYKVNFDLFEKLASGCNPVYELQDAISELVDGISEIKHLIPDDFQSSDFMRLHILENHLNNRRLSSDLRWI